MKKFLSILSLTILLFALAIVCAGCELRGQLDAPTNVHAEGYILKWNSVDGAISYLIYVDDEEFSSSTTRFDLSDTDVVEGQTYSIFVKAKGDGYVKTSSDLSEEYLFTAPPKATQPPQDGGQLSAPTVTKVEYDEVYWTEVPNATSYVLIVNDNYEREVKGLSCALKDVFWEGSPITDYGKVSVKVVAKADGYQSSLPSQVNDSYYYVPESTEALADTMTGFMIGYGINLIEYEYLDTTKCSVNSIFNVKKLLTVGQYVTEKTKQTTYNTYAYSSVEEYISKTKLAVGVGSSAEIECIGSLKVQMNADFGFDFKSYSFNNTCIYECNVKYEQYSFKNYSNVNLLQYCLSDAFLQDVRKESYATKNLTDSELIDYIYSKYGTHAILGVAVGGKYTAKYTVSTNQQDVALSVGAKFNYATTGYFLDVIKTSLDVGIDLKQDSSWSNSETAAHFNVYAYGGGPVAANVENVASSISNWESGIASSPRSIGFTNNGAISIQVLLGLLSPELGTAFETKYDNEYSKLYNLLLDKYSKPVEREGTEIVTTTFDASLWANSKNLGLLKNIKVTGIKVQYQGEYYVYGNAYYHNTQAIGENAEYNVKNIYLKESSRQILMGGIFHWRGGYGLNDECGVSGWVNESSNFNTTTVHYAPEDPGKDLKTNQEIIISITDICVKLNQSAEGGKIVPEIVTSSFSADMFCDEQQRSRLTFSVIGMRVKYDDSFYIMGNAYYSGTPGGDVHDNVSEIYFCNSDKNFLYGGTLQWRGSEDNVHEIGVASFVDTKIGHYNCKYVTEDPGKNFSGGENNIITITGICIEEKPVGQSTDYAPEIGTSSFTASFYSLYTSQYAYGNGTFKVIGVTVKYQGEEYLYGNAIFVGTPGGNFAKDVKAFIMQDFTKNIILGGTLQWTGTLGADNESSIATFDPTNRTDTFICYLHENPYDDFPANEDIIITVTGICVKK